MKKKIVTISREFGSGGRMIGEALANSIVEYRVQNGSFKSIDELKKIDGIGEEKLKKFASQITV